MYYINIKDEGIDTQEPVTADVKSNDTFHAKFKCASVNWVNCSVKYLFIFFSIHRNLSFLQNTVNK